MFCGARETPVEEQLRLHDEKVSVERRPVTDRRSDMVRPDAFPNGVICDVEVTLAKTAEGFEGCEDGNEIVVTDDAVVTKISCGGRTGLFGTAPRVR